MKKIPKDNNIESTFPLIINGYPYLGNKMKKLHTNIFESKIMGKKAICIQGEDAAKLFYDNQYFERKAALPKRVKNTLMGKNGIHSLDGDNHKHRKAMFMSVMSPEKIKKLMNLISKNWKEYANRWEKSHETVLFEEAREILFRSACEWSGVPFEETEVSERTSDFGDMIEGFGGVGLRYLEGKWARKRSEKWINKIIEEVRNGNYVPDKGSVLETFAFHKDLKGDLLDIQIVAVEIINIIRPITAIAYYVVFSALALYDHPKELEKLKNSTQSKDFEYFVQEVRRSYPFTPLLGAKVKDDFEWQGFIFPKDTLVLLDIYGMLHDEDLWENPEQFNPERFKNWDKSPFGFIPQGGGDFDMGHRCAGEWITIEAMKVSLNFLINGIAYKVPEQNLSFSLSRMPTLPEDKFIIKDVTILEEFKKGMKKEIFNFTER